MKKADLQANISVLKQESLSLSSKLTELHEQIAKAKETLSEVSSEINEKLSLLHEEQSKIDSKKEELAIREKTANSFVLEAEAKAKEIESAIKQKNKELAKINSWCLAGEDSLVSLTNKHSEIQKRIEEGNRTLDYIERLSGVKNQLEEDIDMLRKESSSIHETLDKNIYVSNQLLMQEKSEFDKIRQAKELEEIAYYNIRERKLQIENDIQIYITRASLVYQKAFPELEMKL